MKQFNSQFVYKGNDIKEVSVIKRFFYYFGWTIAIGFTVFLGIEFQVRIEEKANREFELMPIILFATLFPIVIGLLLRVPKLIMEIRQNKQRSYDWVKCMAVALPCLYIISMSILPFSPLGVGSIKVPSIIMLGSPTIQIIAGIVLGYTLLDSLYK